MNGKARRILAAVILLLLLVTAFGETILDALPIDQSGWRVRGGNRFYRNEKGDILTGWQLLDGERYYLNPEHAGAASVGWLELEGSAYFFASDGAATTGWAEVEGNTYFFLPQGQMATGWATDGNKRYYFDPEGHPQSGWLTQGNEKFYLLPDGAAATGWTELEGKTYYFDADGAMATGWTPVGEEIYYLDSNGNPGSGWVEGRYLDETGRLCTGWTQLDGKRCYLDDGGRLCTDWLELEEGRYYLNEDGSPYMGWLELDGQTYYLREDGRAARGALEIDGQTHYFTSTGAEILLVNIWNPLPQYYWVPTVTTVDKAEVSPECVADLKLMMADCRAAGMSPIICSSYRTIIDQQFLFNRRLSYWMGMGYSYEQAYEKTKTEVAVPGTSEHHTGLAVDIVDTHHQLLDQKQELMPTQRWLMEHCWEYGFILRYPVGTTEQTGIIYEPWHYRWVGRELAKELHDLDMCLEDYLSMLTEQEQE